MRWTPSLKPERSVKQGDAGSADDLATVVNPAAIAMRASQPGTVCFRFIAPGIRDEEPEPDRVNAPLWNSWTNGGFLEPTSPKKAKKKGPHQVCGPANIPCVSCEWESGIESNREVQTDSGPVGGQAEVSRWRKRSASIRGRAGLGRSAAAGRIGVNRGQDSEQGGPTTGAGGLAPTTHPGHRPRPQETFMHRCGSLGIRIAHQTRLPSVARPLIPLGTRPPIRCAEKNQTNPTRLPTSVMSAGTGCPRCTPSRGIASGPPKPFPCSLPHDLLDRDQERSTVSFQTVNAKDSESVSSTFRTAPALHLTPFPQTRSGTTSPIHARERCSGSGRR